MRKFWFCLILLLQPLVFTFGESSFSSLKQELLSDAAPVQADLIVEETSIQPGRPFWVGVHLKMAKGWETYWVNPGDAGYPTQVHWHLPKGFEAGPMLWPYPERFVADSLVGFGYTGSVFLLVQITPPKNFNEESATLSADVNWLACNESCVPGSANLNLMLPVSGEAPEIDDQASSQFTVARASLPQVLDEGELALERSSENLVLKLKSYGKKILSAQFFPEQTETFDLNSAPEPQIMEEGISIPLPNLLGDAPSSLKGVLVLTHDKGVKTPISIDLPFEAQPAAMASEISSFSVALVLAFLGGLILNVMPCVLPVIALKIFGFAKIAHQDRRLIFKHGAVFALGILFSFWTLSGILMALRTYGEGIGWGFQLQEPTFVAILSAILFLLSLSLFGVFEMGTSLISLAQKGPSSSSPMASSFFSGILATLVATPCTGPLMGPALGFALTLPVFKSLVIFTSMGLGMASPYLVFSAFPRLIRFLPKPGDWMIVFKQFMGFLMMATVVWLVWVFGAQTDSIAVFVLLACFLLIAFGAWIFGRWATPVQRKLTRTIAIAVSTIIIGIGGTFAVLTAKEHRDSGPALEESTQPGDGWEAFSIERIEELRSEGKSVFVDFTAKWCLICQANKMVLHKTEVEEAFADAGVVKMIADWTKRDPRITEELQKFGRSGVPLYVLYPASSEKPYILPQTLTANVLNEYLGKLDQRTVQK